MAKLSEILIAERDRQNRDMWCHVHLYQEGTFLRAYEWSAWLCEREVVQVSEKEFVMNLPDGILPNDSTTESLTIDFDNWKHSVPLSEGKKNKTNNQVLNILNLGSSPRIWSI